ncbi:MAG: hypothetical protein IJ642_06335 [Oscillospiraceae bacterium]|nr:hypothetical protein [Oscillospiraceae bacterium]
MDMKAKIDEIISKTKNDPEFMKKFTSNPVKAVEDVVGVDLPDEQINKIISDVKTKAPDVVSRAKSDPEFSRKLKENPVKAVEDITGIDFPDEQINAAIKGVKDKLLGGKK